MRESGFGGDLSEVPTVTASGTTKALLAYVSQAGDDGDAVADPDVLAALLQPAMASRVSAPQGNSDSKPAAGRGGAHAVGGKCKCQSSHGSLLSVSRSWPAGIGVRRQAAHPGRDTGDVLMGAVDQFCLR